MVGESWEQELEVAGHICSHKAERETDAGTQLGRSPSSSRPGRTPAHRKMASPFRVDLPTSIAQPRNSLIEYMEACLLGDFRFCLS